MLQIIYTINSSLQGHVIIPAPSQLHVVYLLNEGDWSRRGTSHTYIGT